MNGLVRRVSNALTGLTTRRARFKPGADVQIGQGVHLGRNVVFRSDRVRIGDGTVIQDDVTVEATSFCIGEFGTIRSDCFFPGPGDLKIGHNFWLGNGSIVDSKGGTTIGNNVGVGAHSQLWTHMEFGDVMLGCRFHSDRPLTIGDDVWLVGHCLVSPVTIGDRSLAMLGSLVTKDMQADHSYAGAPAKDLTDKLGPQFEVTTVEQRQEYLQRRLDEFGVEHGGRDQFVVVTATADLASAPAGKTVFDVESRTYRQVGSEAERRCIRWLLPDAKFVPAQSS